MTSAWWCDAHWDLLTLLFHTGVMTVEQIARLFYGERPHPRRRAAADVRRLFRLHILDYTCNVRGALAALTLTLSKTVCLGRAGYFLVAIQHDQDPQRVTPRRPWSLRTPAYLQHNLMLAELVTRVQVSYPEVGFGGEATAAISELKKVSPQSSQRKRHSLRYLLKPDGVFRWPDGSIHLVEVERSPRYKFDHILNKVRRYNQVRDNRSDLWQRRWSTETFPPVLMLALDPGRHEARLRREMKQNRIDLLFQSWPEFLQADDPLAGWRFWRDGRSVTIGGQG